MTKSFNRFYELSLFLTLIAFCLLLLTGKFSYAVTEGISLWISCVLPALFPYFFITAVLSSLKLTSKISQKISPFTTKVWRVGGACGYAFLMSIISGYPVGAKIVSDLKTNNLIGEEEAVRASALCSTSSPMFLIGSVGSIMFGCLKFGILLFCCHIICSFLNGIIFSFYKRNAKISTYAQGSFNKKTDNVLYDSVYSAVISILVVGGLITVFHLLTAVLYELGLLNPIINLLSPLIGKEQALGFVLGIFECTEGLIVLSDITLSQFSLPLASFICGFGGISVISQSLAYLKKAKIKTAPFIFAKLSQAVLSFFLGLIFSFIFF